MEFVNSYEDKKRADAYAGLEFSGTYFLAYRDLAGIISEHVNGRCAVDFGCGTGRSTRFLKKLGFSVKGVDIAEDMIKKAREIDPEGDYLLVEDGNLNKLEYDSCDLVLSVFTFDNIPTGRKKIKILKEISALLNENGMLVNLVSSPEIYKHEWASFSTKDFPENRNAKCGDKVKIIITDIDDKRPVEDVIWPEEDYREIYRRAGLRIVKMYKPLAKDGEPFQWINETEIPPWVIYVLGRKKP